MTLRYRYLDTLTIGFVVVLVVSNLVGPKICQIGPLLVSGAQLLFPVTYICGDVFTEVYGYAASRRAIWMGFFAMGLLAVMGQIAHPVGRANPYRIGHDGVPRVLPGTGGITINCRIGDPCVGLAADHVEPGVALHNNGREIIGARNGPNMALLTSACVGNRARVVSGRAAGAVGMVTGKHGGVDHLLVDFDRRTLIRLTIGDRIQIYSCGLGLRLLDDPGVAVTNCAPSL